MSNCKQNFIKKLCTLLIVALSVCSAKAETLPPEILRRANQIISVFENSTTEQQYGYIENLNDGRGYTAGWAGFCSGTGDLLDVVEAYTLLQPKNPLSIFLPALKKLADSGSDDVSELVGLPQVWSAAANDPLFRQAQDMIVTDNYLVPALGLAVKYNLHTNFSKVALYEAAIQHGVGDDGDSVEAMLKEAVVKIGEQPTTDERQLMRMFLDIRRAHLLNPVNPETQDVWAQSVGRADAMKALFESGNLDLVGPFTINPWGTPVIIQ